MTVITAPLSRGKTRTSAVMTHARKFFAKILSPARPALLNLVSIPLTVAGIGFIDTGVFIASTVAGWIVTGVSLLVLEHMIADETK